MIERAIRRIASEPEARAVDAQSGNDDATLVVDRHGVDVAKWGEPDDPSLSKLGIEISRGS